MKRANNRWARPIKGGTTGPYGKVPVIRLGHLSEAQKRAYRIADNKLAELGTWSIELLQMEFKALDELKLDMPLTITGYDMGDIDLILEGKETKIDPKANNIPFIPDNEIVSQEGDIWQLDKHRLICGNSLKKETLTALMEDKKPIWYLRTHHIT